MSRNAFVMYVLASLHSLLEQLMRHKGSGVMHAFGTENQPVDFWLVERLHQEAAWVHRVTMHSSRWHATSANDILRLRHSAGVNMALARSTGHA